MKRFGLTRWNGGLREGQGAVSTESRALENSPYSFFTRYGEKPGTNPEELLGAAHAACFTMSFVRMLAPLQRRPLDPRSAPAPPARHQYRALAQSRRQLESAIPGPRPRSGLGPYPSIYSRSWCFFAATLTPPPTCRRERDFCRRRQAAQNLPKRRDLCAETQEPPSRSRKTGRKLAFPQEGLPRRV